MEYDWPVNVRELANVMAQVAAMCDGPVVLKEHLPRKILENIPGSVAAPAVSVEIVESDKSSEQKWLGEIEKHLQTFAEQVDFKRGFELSYFLSEQHILELSKAAAGDVTLITNPRDATVEQIADIYRAAL